jgi:hypothetical protein
LKYHWLIAEAESRWGKSNAAGTRGICYNTTLRSLEETMSSQVSDELREFHRFVSDKLNEGAADWSPEEALDEWRRLHPQAIEEDVAAIAEALGDMANGDRGMLFDQFDREFRKQHNLRAKS